MLLGMSKKVRRPTHDRYGVDKKAGAVEPPAPAVSETRLNIVIKLPAIKQLKKGLLPILAATAIVLVIVGYWLFKPSHKHNPSTTLGQSIAKLVSIPAYYPQNLPNGYTYNKDAKAIKVNVLYFSVTGPGNQTFYVSQQSVPASFDFVGFDKKFLNPDNFSTDAGSTIAGQVGANMIGSVLTDKNTWIIINTGSTSSLTELETVARSLERAQ